MLNRLHLPSAAIYMNEIHQNNSAKKSGIPLYLSLALLIIMLVSYFVIPAFQQFLNNSWNVLTSDDEARIRNWVEGFGWLGPIMIILVMVSQMFLLIIPSILLMVVAVLAYGPIWGSVLSFISVLTASTIGYFIGEYLGATFITRLVGKKSLSKVSSFVNDYGFWAVVITRVNPFLSNDAISLVGGILKMNYWKFILATLTGISPLIIILGVTGSSTDTLKKGLLWVSLASILVFGIYFWLDKRSKKIR